MHSAISKQGKLTELFTQVQHKQTGEYLRQRNNGKQSEKMTHYL